MLAPLLRRAATASVRAGSFCLQRRALSASVLAEAREHTRVPMSRLLSLDDLRDNAGAVRKKKLLGRGPGSGKGKTCGKGHKGIWARRSLGKRGYEGGQNPLWKATPKYGFNRDPKIRRRLDTFGIDKLLVWIRTGRLDTSKKITMRCLVKSGILGHQKSVKWGVKMLAGGEQAFITDFPKLGVPVPELEMTDVSQKAKDALEQVGGKVSIVWMAKVPLQAHLKPHKFDLLPRGNGIPPRKYRAKYGYVFPENRIYTGKGKTTDFAPRVPGLDVNSGRKGWPKPLK